MLNELLDVSGVEDPLVGFELFNIILNIFDSLPHVFELFYLLLHLLATYERNLSEKAHDLSGQIILQVDLGFVEFFVPGHPTTCFSNLLLEGIIFKVLDP